MVNKWRKMPSADRLRVQIVIGMLLIGLYGALAYPFSFKKYKEAKNLLHRRMDRIEKRTETDVKAPATSIQSVSRQIEEIDKKLSEIKEGFNELDTGFAPVDSSDMRQQLLVEISTLARRTGVELQSVASKGMEGKSGQELLKSGKQGAESAALPTTLDSALGRPLLIVKATSQFQPLMAFLRGLKELSFYVSPMQVRLYSRHLKDTGKGAGSGASVPMGEDDGSLNIFLELSM